MKKKAILLFCACLALSACGTDDGRRVAKLELIPNDAVVFQETRVDAGDAQEGAGETRGDAMETREDAGDAWESGEDARADDGVWEDLGDVPEQSDDSGDGQGDDWVQKRGFILGAYMTEFGAFGDDGEAYISEDGEDFIINLWMDGLSAGVISKRLAEGKTPGDWIATSQMLLVSSQSVLSQMSDNGYGDMGLYINLASDVDHSVALLSAYNGEIVYDFLETDEKVPHKIPV